MTKPFAIIIEDDPVLGELYRSALKIEGYETCLDANGDGYAEQLSNPNLAVVLLDLHLPHASGIEILAQIRADKRWENIPVIVTTADLYGAKNIEGRANYVLMKPVSMTRLMQALRSLRE